MSLAAYITGRGIVASIGVGVPEVARALAEDRPGIAPITRFDARRFGEAVAGEVPWTPTGDLCIGFALRAAGEAWAESGCAARNVPVVVGSSAGPHSYEDAQDGLEASDPAAASVAKAAAHHASVAEAVARSLGLVGPRFAPATACASGNVALALALDLVRMGWPAVLVGGAEALGWRRLAGFYALGVLAPGPCAPFSAPAGMTLGEGAAFFVLEADPKGRPTYGVLAGYGLSADAWHATAPDPRGRGMARAMGSALADAEIGPGDVAGYAAHATGTDSNDAAEWAAVQAAFGDRPPAVFATKSRLGHSFGASGPQAVMLALLGAEAGRWPATHGWRGPRADGPDAPPVVVGSAGEVEPGAGFMAMNAAFGGANAAVVVRSGAATSPRAAAPVYLLRGGLASGDDDPGALRRALPRVDPRGLDRAGWLLTLAVGRALGGRGGAERTGLLTGVSRRPASSGELYRASLRDGDGTRGSASAFARGVMNASAGATALALGLRGPGATLADGRGAGLHALAWGWWMVATRPDVEQLVVGAVDERPLEPVLMDPEAPGVPASGLCLSDTPTDVAAAVVLGRSGAVRVVGVGFSGPDAPLEACLAATGGLPVAWLVGSAGGPRGRAVEADVARTLGCAYLLFEGPYGEASASLRPIAGHAAEPLAGRTVYMSWCPRVGAVAVVVEA